VEPRRTTSTRTPGPRRERETWPDHGAGFDWTPRPTAPPSSARKYVFRKRVLMVIAVILVGSERPRRSDADRWWGCGSATAITVLYGLSAHTKIEEKGVAGRCAADGRPGSVWRTRYGPAI